jgi:hypothetical protein
MNLDKADILARETDYADAATHQDDNPINWGDAAAFFLEGYEYSRKVNQWTTAMKVAFTRYTTVKEWIESGKTTKNADILREMSHDAVSFIEAAITARDLDTRK